MPIEIVRNPEDLPRLREGWEALCADAAESATVFSTFQWYETWWRHYSADAALNIIVMREGERVIGVAPLMLTRAKLHGLPAAAVGFIHNRQSLHNDFVVRPADRERFLREVLATLFRQRDLWDVIMFRNLPEQSENRELLARLLAESGRSWCQCPTWYDSPYLLPSGSWEEYLAGRSARTRKSLRNIQNSMHRGGEVEVRRIRTREDFLQAREAFFSVAGGSWAESAGDSPASPQNAGFFLELAQKAAEKGWLSLWMLLLDGKAIAVEFHLRAFAKEHALRGHYLPEYAPLSPGTYLETRILREVFREEDRLRCYDFCGSFESYKRKWTDRYAPHCDLLAFGDSLYGALLALHEKVAVPFLKRALKRGCGSPRPAADPRETPPESKESRS